jgi:hypothetical protein
MAGSCPVCSLLTERKGQTQARTASLPFLRVSSCLLLNGLSLQPQAQNKGIESRCTEPICSNLPGNATPTPSCISAPALEGEIPSSCTGNRIWGCLEMPKSGTSKTNSQCFPHIPSKIFRILIRCINHSHLKQKQISISSVDSIGAWHWFIDPDFRI